VKARGFISLAFATLLSICLIARTGAEDSPTLSAPTSDDGSWLVLSPNDAKLGPHHVRHAEVFGKYVTGYNLAVLRGIDTVQSSAMDGGGYFTGVKAVPAESPIGYPLSLLGKPLLAPPRKTSYCSGASYSAFIESLNLIVANASKQLSNERFEALRKQ
jgi:hypothetical protein